MQTEHFSPSSPATPETASGRAFESRQDSVFLAEQCLVEHRTLSHVKAALRLCLDWQVASAGYARKLATVRFTAQSFRRHLERLLDLEEKDGFMSVVGQLKPNLANRAARLREEHDVLRSSLARLLFALESAECESPTVFSRLCTELYALLHRLDVHDSNETRLLQEVVLQDEGGEGG